VRIKGEKLQEDVFVFHSNKMDRVLRSHPDVKIALHATAKGSDN